MTLTIHEGAPAWCDAMSAAPEADAAFLTALFGWDVTEAASAPAAYRTFTLEGRAVLGLAAAGAGEQGSRHWNTHFAVADCDAVAARAMALGGTVIVEPTDASEAVRFAMLRDPVGASFGVLRWAPGTPGFGAFGEPGAVSWLDYHYDGVPAVAMAFYERLLGWEVVVPPWVPADSPKPYAALSPGEGGDEFGGCHAAEGAERERPPQWSAVVAVADVDAICERAPGLGGSVALAAADAPGVRIGAVASPSGLVTGVLSDR